ncbi:MAG TPA: glycosyltransferase family 4 protein, partial [Chloroflexota bacterium]|nr:glycosyltransferase family 4 protein [Chloroflexota bacterium]
DIPPYLNWQRDLAWSAVRRADAVVCPSSFLAQEIARANELERTPTTVHNGVMPLPELSELIEREPRLAVVVGRAWDEAKNIALVAEMLHTLDSGWEVVVAGDLVEPGRAPVPAHQAPGLQYAGFLDKDQLSKLFRRASLFIAPSRYEPFGLAAVEAALCGCAIVANDLPSYHEVWGDAATYFARNDPRSLAMCLDRLAADLAEVARLSRAAHDRASSRYTVEQMVDGYVALYRRQRWTSHSGRLPAEPLTHHR